MNPGSAESGPSAACHLCTYQSNNPSAGARHSICAHCRNNRSRNVLDGSDVRIAQRLHVSIERFESLLLFLDLLLQYANLRGTLSMKEKHDCISNEGTAQTHMTGSTRTATSIIPAESPPQQSWPWLWTRKSTCTRSSSTPKNKRRGRKL